MHYPTFLHSHSSMATLIGGGDSDSSDTDYSSSSSSSSSSGSNTDINASLIKSYGERSKEKCDSNKEGPKGSTKKEQGTINKNTKSDKVKEERKEAEKETEKPSEKASEKEKTKATKSIKLIKRIIAKNKSRTSKVNKKLNLVLKTVSAEQRHNKAALRKTRKIASLASKKTK